MLKAVIFDMDGVIIDSEPFHWQVNQKIFSDLGIGVSALDYQKYIGSSNTNMWTELKARFGLPQPLEDLVEIQGAGNIKFLKENYFGPIEGIAELLLDLKKNEVAIGLASSSPLAAINIVVDKFAFQTFFSATVSGEDFKKSKPAPDIFLKTAQLLRVLPKQCAVIEDSTNGIAAARAAAMMAIGFANKNSWAQDLSQADLIVDNIKKLDFEKIRALFIK